MIFILSFLRNVSLAIWVVGISILIIRMADVEIDMSGELSAPVILDKLTGTRTSFKRYLTVPSVTAFVKSSRDSIRPWGEFTNTTNFKAPQNFSRFLKRAVNNLKHFQGNYLVVALILMAYSLLTSPLLMLSIFASLVACYVLSLRHSEKKMVIAGREVSLQQQYGLVGMCSLPLYYWAGVGQAVFWVIGASCFVVSLHAGLYNIEAVLPEQDQLEVLLDQI